MAIHWQIQFCSQLGTQRTVNIYDETYTGEPVQLTPATNPFRTSENDDLDYYAPIRTQSGYISIYAESATIAEELIATKSLDRPVTLTEGSSVVWMGFLQCELYTQPWQPVPYKLDLPVISAIAAYQDVEVPDRDGVISLLDLLNLITIPGVTNEYILPDLLPIDKVKVPMDAFREYLSIPERADYGVTGMYNRQSIYDAIYAFCQYFGVSCRQYQDHLVLVRDNEAHYVYMAQNGDTTEAQFGDLTLTNMGICGARNTRSYSQAYRRVKSVFHTQKNKFDSVFLHPDFFKEYGVNPTGGAPSTGYLFNGNDIAWPYKDGVHKAEWFGFYDYGGQIARLLEGDNSDPQRQGYSYANYYVVSSQENMAGNPSPALKFNLQKKIFVVDGEKAAINIDCSVSPYYEATQSEGFIKKLHCKIRVGNYWVAMVENPGYLPGYTWTTTESTCWLKVNESGAITLDGMLYNLDTDLARSVGRFSGFSMDLPPLAAGSHDVYFELLANAEATADFGGYSAIIYKIEDLSINLLHGVEDPTNPTPDFEQNEYIRTAGARWSDDYEIESSITTHRGKQYGAGCALDEDSQYITTRYDLQGVVRRAAFYSVPREVLTVDVRANTQPIDGVTYGSDHYLILSQSIDWWNDVNQIKLIKD